MPWGLIPVVIKGIQAVDIKGFGAKAVITLDGNTPKPFVIS